MSEAGITQERDGWSRVPHWLLKAVKPTSVVVYAALAIYADLPLGACPSIKRLGDDIGASEDTVRRALRDLEKAGAMTIEYRSEGPAQMTSRYHLAITQNSRTDAPPPRTDAGRGGGTDATRGGAGMPPEEDSLDSDSVQSPRAHTKKPKAAAPQGDFETWWSTYPRKDARAAAEKAYPAALKHISAEELLAKTKAFPFQGEKRFYPYGATWLNGRRWEDIKASEPSRPRSRDQF